MAERKNIKEIARGLAALLSDEFRIQKIILFGSYARGNYNKYSDIDLAVISPDFGKENEMEEMAHLLKRAHEIDIDIEPHPYTPREFRNPHRSSFVHEILKTGKVVYRNNRCQARQS